MCQNASLLEVLHSGLVAAEEDDAGAGAPQALVRRRRHDVGVLEGARDHAGCRQATEVRNVGKEVGVHLHWNMIITMSNVFKKLSSVNIYLVRNLTESCKVE